MSVDSLVLVKHAMPVIVKGAPPRTWLLSEEGRQATTELASALAEFLPTAVITSVEPKAAGTGDAIAAVLGVSCDSAPGLHEHERDAEPFEGRDQFHSRMRRFFAEPSAVVYGTESADAAHARFEQAIRQVEADYPPGPLVIVSHGTVITLLVARANGLDPFPFWRDLALPSFVVVERGSHRLLPTG